MWSEYNVIQCKVVTSIRQQTGKRLEFGGSLTYDILPRKTQNDSL